MRLSLLLPNERGMDGVMKKGVGVVWSGSKGWRWAYM